jgi:hypothetical protein
MSLTEPRGTLAGIEPDGRTKSQSDEYRDDEGEPLIRATVSVRGITPPVSRLGHKRTPTWVFIGSQRLGPRFLVIRSRRKQ